jgi:hypothetical protein
MTETSLEKLDLKKFDQEVQVYRRKASDLIIHDERTLKLGNDLLLDIKTVIKKIDETFDPAIKKVHEAHKEIIARKKEIKEPYVSAENEVKLRIASYVKRAEEERKEAERKAAEEEEKRMKAQVHAEELASELEQKGHVQEAQEVRDRVPEFKAPVLPKTPALNNVQVKWIFKWDIEDINVVPRQFLTVDRAKVTAYVNMHREKTNIPGIRVFKESSVAARV